MEKIKVWDLPIRIFHWILVIAIIICFVSIKKQNITVHQYAGVFVLIAVIFRIIWGFIGSTTARFWDFVKSPIAFFDYMRTSKAPTEGHNPMGAYMVLFMLFALLAQSVTGLFLGDNTYMHQDSPLYKLIGSDMREIFKQLHFYSEYVIYGMVALHVLVVIVYLFAKKQNLIGTMITGKRAYNKLHNTDAKDIKYDHSLIALIIFIILALLITYMLYGYAKEITFMTWMGNIYHGLGALF